MSRMRVIVCLCAFALLVAGALAVQDTARACFVHSPQPVQVWNDEIEIDIIDQVAFKKYTCVFYNPNPQAVVDGECFMELSPGAQVDGFTMMIDDEEVQGELLTVEKANEVFAEIIRNGGSPALLEYYGNQLFHTRIPNIPPQGTVTVKLHYALPLRAVDGVVRLSMLNTNPKMKMQALKSASVTIRIQSETPVTNIYSPTHEVHVDEAADDDAIVIRWSEEDYLPKNPFVLYYATTPDPLGVNLIAHKEAGSDDGAFMLMLAPGGQPVDEDAPAINKDIVFCVDTSLSMVENGKLGQLRGALDYCVENLREGDTFNIVDFGTTTRLMSWDGMLPVSEGTIARAKRHIADNITARGATAIAEGLETALEQFDELTDDPTRLRAIVFVTDGVPTVGQFRDADSILERVRRQNRNNVRMFSFGVGTDVNAKLLDMLAYENHGQSDYILPQEDINEKIAAFFDRVGTPIMTNISYEFAGAAIADVYPRSVPDLFAGDQVIVFGRYRGQGEATITLTGYTADGQGEITRTFDLPEQRETHSWLPRLWAGRKIDFLLAELKENPNDQELIDAVVELARRYGIVTPYTNYLLTNDVFASAEAQGQQFQNRLRRAANAAPSAEDRPGLASDSARMAEGRDDDGHGGDMYDRAQAEAEALNGSSAGSVMDRMRYIGAKTFYFDGTTWIDSSRDSETEPQIVIQNSDEYFALIAADTDIAKYMAMGNVIVNFKGTLYHIQSE